MSESRVTSFDELQGMEEEELRRRHRSIVRAIRRVNDSAKRAELEVEACYFAREIEVRETRRELDSQYQDRIRSRRSVA